MVPDHGLVVACHLQPALLGGINVMAGKVTQHWAFDVGWFALSDDYRIQISPEIQRLPSDFGKMADYELIRSIADGTALIFLPKRSEIRPHRAAIRWHRDNIFGRLIQIREGTI